MDNMEQKRIQFIASGGPLNEEEKSWLKRHFPRMQDTVQGARGNISVFEIKKYQNLYDRAVREEELYGGYLDGKGNESSLIDELWQSVGVNIKNENYRKSDDDLKKNWFERNDDDQG